MQQNHPRLLHEALLPAPNTCLGDVGPAHDLDRTNAISAQQHDGSPPDVFLSRIPGADDGLKAKPLGRCEGNEDARAHVPTSNAQALRGIFKPLLLSGQDH